MKKILKKWGNSLVIIIDPEDKKVYGLSVGDVIDIEFTKVQGVKEQ